MNFREKSNNPINRISHVISLFTKLLFFFIIIWNITIYLSFEQNEISLSDSESLQTVSPLSTNVQTSNSVENSNFNISTPLEIENNDIDISINRKYCGSNECKFLFAYRIPEQETQANSHFYSFTQLAEMLNRTMVLVNVQNSRIESCKNLPFNFYYNIEELKKLFPTVNFITQEEFLNWTKERYKKPNAIFRSILPGGIPNTISNTSITRQDLNKAIRERCLDKFDFKFNMENDYPILNSIHIGPNTWRKFHNNIDMTKFLVSYLQEIDEQVLLISHDLRNPLFPSKGPNIPLPYASHLVEAANSVTKHLRPYIAIHWRQESAVTRMMPTCAINLVKYIKRLKLQTGIENIYLATDYPLYQGGKKAQSSTFHTLYQEHHDSMKILNSTFNLNTWVSLKTLDVLYELFPQFKHYIEKEFEGSGIQGIFDKLVLINSEYFVSGPRGCARISSNFTKKIYMARKLLMKINKNIHNDVSHWSIERR
ncbi:hypothetical protein C1645_816382 [Glomus cerebriforme]|uniref:GDP-fucose protein O-fucosyltransferase 2 n=1 Tax=Glomus cerebriforme TaxID=658196 RepID=A0A397TKZ3_9GLOM|nr:hypothetical protein C1645_816382 [Glomus cerebriforme]